MDYDDRIRLASRILTLLAFATFLAWVFLATQHPWVILVALAFGLAAYAFYLTYLRRNPVEVEGYGPDAQDRVEEGSDVAVSPGVSAAGIHLSLETRSRWRAKR